MDIADVPDPGHRALLSGSGVIASDLEEFKALVVQRLAQLQTPPAAAATRVDDEPLVFVDTEPANMELAHRLGDVLARAGASYALPIHDVEPALARAELEEMVVACDALLLVYGTDTVWARQRLVLYRKLQSMRDSPLRGIGIYDGPPPDKARINFMIPGMQIIDGRTGLDEARVRRFLAALKA